MRVLLDTHALLWWVLDSPLLGAKARDPFDRTLVAQALTDGLVLVSNEPAFDSYDVRRLW